MGFSSPVLVLALSVLGAWESGANPVEESKCTPGPFAGPNGELCFCPSSEMSSGIHCSSKKPIIPPCGQKCIPGVAYTDKDLCNDCGCPPDGDSCKAACTLKLCLPPISTPSPCDETCVPGSTFPAEDGCNTCVCPPSGLLSGKACTFRPCPPPPVCTPGEYYSPDGCNTCFCGCDGQPEFCSLINCPPFNDLCTPYTIFRPEGTNKTCFCPKSGLKAEAFCSMPPPPPTTTVAPTTEAPCSDEPPITTPSCGCVPGETVPAPDGCNTCICPESGNPADAHSCTEIFCPEPNYCVPGTSVPSSDGCNTCICPESGNLNDPNIACTKKLCPNYYCVPGTSIPAPDGCNTCVCPASGDTRDAMACTMKACVDPSTYCVPGSSIPAGDGCNICTCPESGRTTDAMACTLKACLPFCEPGSSIPAPDGSCNRCICPESGNPNEALACTKIFCPPTTAAPPSCDASTVPPTTAGPPTTTAAPTCCDPATLPLGECCPGQNDEPVPCGCWCLDGGYVCADCFPPTTAGPPTTTEAPTCCDPKTLPYGQCCPGQTDEPVPCGCWCINGGFACADCFPFPVDPAVQIVKAP